MSEWVEDNLGHLANIEIGGTPSRDVPAFWANENANGHPWVSIADLGPRYVAATKERITELGVLSSNVKLVRRGTLLMSFKLTIGRAGIADFDLFTNEAIAAVIPEQKTLDSGFLYYLLPPIACGAVTDTAIKGSTLNKQTLARLKLRFLKDVRQQRRIAEILSTVDEAIEQTEALIAKYQQIKAGLMQDLFTRGLSPEASAKGDVTWTLRPTSAQAPHLYKESPLGLIPKAWSFGLLSDFLLGGPKNGYSPQEVSEWSGLYALGLGCLTGEGFKPNQLKVVGLGGLQCHQALLQDGDFLLSRSNTRELVGLCGIYRDVGSPCIYPDLMMRIRPNGRTSAEFLEALLLSPLMRVRITSAAVGTSGSMVKLNSRAVLRLQLAMPEKDEQTHILKFIHTQRETLMSFEYDLAKLRQQKQGLMQDLLTGRVRVKVGEAEEQR